MIPLFFKVPRISSKSIDSKVFQGAEKMVEEVLRLSGDPASVVRSHMASMENKFASQD